MKKMYVDPQLDIIPLSAGDVILASGDWNGEDIELPRMIA